MLSGSALLAKVKDMGEASKSDLMHAFGYVSTKKDGSERLNFGGGGAGGGKAGRKLRYTAQLGLELGDEFEIKLDRPQGHPPGAGGRWRRGGVNETAGGGCLRDIPHLFRGSALTIHPLQPSMVTAQATTRPMAVPTR
jgi:hypothetical protein